MKTLLLALALTAAPLFAQVPEGDQHFAARAQGAQGAHAVAGQIDAAIAAYQRALAANPNDLEAHYKLLRAYRYKGAYVTRTNDEKKAVYAAAKAAGAAALKVVERMTAAKGVKANASEKQVADAIRGTRAAAEVYLWDAVNWGEWALAYGKLAAARQGAADRIKREATIAMLVDPRLEEGAPARVLGRLHDQTPRIPFLTGWASSKEAVRFLEESMKIDPPNKLTLVFLAEAMVSNDSSTKPKAIQMLKGVISAPNNPLYVVEDAAATEDAKALLRKFGG
ncbi:MAG TPA: tetratricopeptide repeat protein [Thermoanaerobaculia bacterium]|nr:tetratricopeptide repeat protein [Thermoanaerobaculia bacterium]